MAEIQDLRHYVTDHIDEAIEKEDIKIYYQPIVRTLTGDVCEKEALARWDSPEYGLMKPEQFIPVLEDYKLIYKLDCFVIKKICSHYRHCADRKDPLLPISVNLSWLDFELCDIMSVLNEETEKCEMPRNMLKVEINESLISHDSELIKNKLKELHDEGYEIIMDDFGSGHSSLNILKDYVFDGLKIDMKLLWSDSDRSKKLIQYLCSMAKALDVKTMAEGVENEEQLKFLIHTGCEKLQGYYFGKPMFYWDLVPYLREKGMSVERLNMKDYYDIIGKIDLKEKAGSSYAIVEFKDGAIRFIYANEEYKRNAASLGLSDIDAVEQLCNDPDSDTNSKFNASMQKSREKKKVQVVDFVQNGCYCIARIMHIVGNKKQDAAELELFNLSLDSKVNHLQKINDALEGVYSVFDRVVELDLDRDRTKILFKDTEYTEKYDSNLYSENRDKYINREIYADDRERYRQFADFKNAESRIVSSGRNYISGCFRFRNSRGNYVWREQFIILSHKRRKSCKFLICTREVDERQLALLMELSSLVPTGANKDSLNTGKTISEEVLWRSSVEACPVGLFWKDTKRRFLGVNQAFLNYYGFESEEEVIGKTDEEMNWHVDPVPFKNDEEDILKNGSVKKDVVGKCLCRGENRDIMANKAPVYEEGKIVGIIGYFRDITERNAKYDALKDIAVTDPVTGLRNIRGLMEAVSKYVGAYEDNDRDFAMAAFSINRYRELKEEYGEEHRDNVMRSVAARLKRSAGTSAVIGRPSTNVFMVIRQVESGEEGPSFMQNISNEIRSIRKVDGIPCTLYASAGYATYSECGSSEALYAATMKRMNDQIERMRRFTGDY